MWPSSIDKIYVICHKVKEKERYDRLVSHLNSINIPKDKIEFVAPIWSDELTSDMIFNVYDPFLPRPSPGLTFKGRGLSKGEISLALNFYACIKNAVESKYNNIITIESDVWLRSDFIEQLNNILNDTIVNNKEWDYISLGEGVGTRPPNLISTSYFYPAKTYQPPHQCVYRCTDSMLFKVSYLEKIIKTFIPFREIIDWEMNYQHILHNGIALWADPPLAEQGTCFARMISSLPA